MDLTLRPAPLLAFLLFISIFFTSIRAEGFNRDRCYSKVTSLLSNGSLNTDDAVFHRDKGVPMSGVDNPVLTLPGCYKFCGKQRLWYLDAGARLNTWIVPVFLLLSNLEVSPLDKRRYLMLVHLLGDPIDSMWSLLSKLEVWSRCYGTALVLCGLIQPRKVRNLATVLGAIEELTGYASNPIQVYNAIMLRTALTGDGAGDELDRLVGRIAQRLSDNRTDEWLRTILATALYFFQLLSAFVAVIGGGQTSPPGGRIGTAMFMTWLIPTILLSNAIGGYTSIRTCYSIIEDFVKDVTGDADLWSQLRETAPGLRSHGSLEEYFDSLTWEGAIYTYRPVETISFKSGYKDRNKWLLLALAVSPIIVSSVFVSVIIWNTPPIAISCRNFMIWVIVILFFLSALLTWFIARLNQNNFMLGRTQWYITLVKDALIGIPSVALIFLATAGVFNSCWCWSGVYSLGKAARVPLNPVPEFLLWNRTTYPALVGACLFFQILVFVAMMKVSWAGWEIMRWSEKEKREEWNRFQRRLARNDYLKNSR